MAEPGCRELNAGCTRWVPGVEQWGAGGDPEAKGCSPQLELRALLCTAPAAPQSLPALGAWEFMGLSGDQGLWRQGHVHGSMCRPEVELAPGHLVLGFKKVW